MLVFLPLAGATASTVADDAHVENLYLGAHLVTSCAPYAWSDYVLNVTEAMTGYNLLFEVENTDAAYNPTGLSVSLWTGSAPSNRHAEHKIDRATGKMWVLGMNNKCVTAVPAAFPCGCTVSPVSCLLLAPHFAQLLQPRRDGARDPVRRGGDELCDSRRQRHRRARTQHTCLGRGATPPFPTTPYSRSPEPTLPPDLQRAQSFAPPPPVSLPPTHPPQSCPGEWVYHFIDTASIGGDGRHYGSGHHLMYTLTKRYGSGSSSAVTRHVAAPIKVVPPYVTIGSDTAYGENVTITM